MVRHIEMPGGGPKATRSESKAETTTAVATSIIETEAAARIAKTERLRAARLAQPAPEVAPKLPKAKTKTKAKAKAK
jgi:hypothetical protein